MTRICIRASINRLRERKILIKLWWWTSRRLAELRVLTQQLIPALFLISALFLPICRNHALADLSRDVSVLTSKGAGARFARARELKKLKCFFCRMYMLNAKSARGNGIIARPCRWNIAV